MNSMKSTTTTDDACNFVDSVWDHLGCRVRLPGDEASFLDPEKIPPMADDDRRVYRRMRFRRRAILLAGGRHHAIYTINISVVGLAALHHEPLQVGQEVRVRFNSAARLDYEVRRCRALGPRCFEWAGRALPDQPTAEVIRSLLRQG